jgi:cysteine synthase
MSREIVDRISDCVGVTPIVKIKHDLVPNDKQLFAKIESFNPNFSGEDRTAIGFVHSALANGALKKNGLLIESTSGNLGKSLAMLGAIYGFEVIVVVDPKVSPKVLNWYRAFGAQVDLVTEPHIEGGFQKARIARVQELLELHPGAYWPNQYDNVSNKEYHYYKMGPEILEDVRSTSSDLVVGSVSTGGHLSGIGSYIKSHCEDVGVVAADIAGSSIFGGKFTPYLINGVGLSWRSQNTDFSAFDNIVVASDQMAISVCREISKSHGFLLGGSSGLVIFAALSSLLHSEHRSALAILPDSGINYLDQIYDDDWLDSNGISLMGYEQLCDSLRRTPPSSVPEE